MDGENRTVSSMKGIQIYGETNIGGNRTEDFMRRHQFVEAAHIFDNEIRLSLIDMRSHRNVCAFQNSRTRCDNITMISKMDTDLIIELYR